MASFYYDGINNFKPFLSRPPNNLQQSVKKQAINM